MLAKTHVIGNHVIEIHIGRGMTVFEINIYHVETYVYSLGMLKRRIWRQYVQSVIRTITKNSQHYTSILKILGYAHHFYD